MVEATNLLTKIAQGDRTALSQLYDRYARIVYAIAHKSLNSIEDCEEVVLDVFAQVWRIADKFDLNKGSGEQWLFTLARSRILDKLRKRQQLNKISEAVSISTRLEPATSVDPIEVVEIGERRQLVLAALSLIPPEQCQIIELAYYQGLSHSEIASQTGLAIGTVKTRLRLGLSKLKTAINYG